MSLRQTRSVKLVSSSAPPLEIELEEGIAMGSSSEKAAVYCCVAAGKKILYSYNSRDDHELDTLAASCVEAAPLHHRHFCHTAGSRTYGFLTDDDGHTFFAIVDPTVGSAGTVEFLEHVRDGFHRASSSKNGFPDALVPVLRRLIASLEKMPRSQFLLEDISESDAAGSSTSSSTVPLLGSAGAEGGGGGRKERKKNKERGVNHGDGEQRIDMPSQDGAGGAGSMGVERSGSQGRLRRQQTGWATWQRQLRIIIVVDVVVCLVLLGTWLAICKGFQCVSGG